MAVSSKRTFRRNSKRNFDSIIADCQWEEIADVQVDELDDILPANGFVADSYKDQLSGKPN